MGNITVAYGEFIVRYRWAVLILSLVCVAFVMSGMKGLFFSDDYRIYFGPDNPQLAAQDALEETYTKVDVVSFVLKADEGEVFTPRVLGLIEDITEKSWQIPFVVRVDSLTNYQNTRAEEDDLIVDDLVRDAQTLTEQQIAYAREVALNEPSLLGRLISEDAKTTQIIATVERPNNDPETLKQIVRDVRAIKESYRESHPDIHIALNGVVMLSNAFSEAAENDTARLIPIMFGILALTMLIFLRSFLGMVCTMTVVFMSVLIALGFAGFMKIGLNGASVNAPIIILTISVADAIHLLITYFTVLRKGADRRAATIESIRINIQPVFLTSLTTIIGFLSLNFNDSPPFRDMGNLSAIGVAAAWALSMTLLPALMAIIPMKPSGRGETEARLMAAYVEWVIGKRKAIMWGSALVVVGLALFIPRLTYNDKFVEFFSPNIQFRADSDFLMDNLTGVYMMEVSIPSGEPSGIAVPQYLEKLDKFERWLKDQPEVRHVMSYADIMKRLNKSLHGDDPAEYKLPGDRNLAAQYLLLYEMSLPYGLDLNNQIDVDKSATRLTAILGDINSTQMKEIKYRAEDWMTDNFPENMQPDGMTSVNLIFAFLTKRTFDSMFWGTGLAFVLISFCLVIALRSLKLGLVSLVPNIMPAVLAFGVWAIIEGEIGMYAAGVTATALGLIVDCTVHFLSKYQRGREEKGFDAEDAIRYSFSMVGSALWISSLVLVFGFSTLTFSNFTLNSHMGALTALIIGIALLTDFLLLPALLLYVDRKKDMKDDTVVQPA